MYGTCLPAVPLLFFLHRHDDVTPSWFRALESYVLRVLDGNELKLWSSPSLSVFTVFVDLFFIHTISVGLISGCSIEQYFCCIFIVQRHIHHIKECMLLSCVASFEDWSNTFRTRSFTLCKNDLDFNDMSDSATVLESSSSTINLPVCSANKPVVVHLQVSPFLLPSLHPISTLEKTTCRQCSILSSLMS